jgi:ArsR family transcriptional regulator, arsenate/arsenite/antimonite-responsive transcriptional repressor
METLVSATDRPARTGTAPDDPRADTLAAVGALAALAHESRLSIFRLLVQAGPAGLAAGEIAATLGIPAPTLSFHLKDLAAAGLVSSSRDGRFVRYAADLQRMGSLLAYLTRNCCQGMSCEAVAVVGDALARCR